jgi:hypothetical protein
MEKGSLAAPFFCAKNARRAKPFKIRGLARQAGLVMARNFEKIPEGTNVK